ncbi:hypothetical protein N1031_10970 [Herbiconiux moechotypicola]|uniref:Uncharacterized protein n=1 Tax=Herbiconiux moechotypicola TaxID=637393 RepID=A0ABP5QI40_9MICO|nr:hypothetical protein [Herbiconiux moechotypicola]MCS5730283.1 hypothetical protein [Herbiconiux moechotypicola]
MAQLLDVTALRQEFVNAGVPEELAGEALGAFVGAKRRFHLGDFRPNAVEGGRFSEAVLRILEWQTTGTYTPLSDPKFKADAVITRLGQLSAGSHPESVRLHLPRAVRVVYDIRNKRNAAHLSDGIDPSMQDASIVVATLDWILAELVRLNHTVSATEAQRVIEALVRREVPMIQEFNGRPRILKTLSHADHLLVLLYWWGDRPIARSILNSWLPANMRKNSTRVLRTLHDGYLITLSDDEAHITQLGLRSVEERQLIGSL